MSPNTTSIVASEHPLNAVMIFQSSTAQLTRTFTVDLKSGVNVLEISGISSHVDTESPRIYGLGVDTRILDMSCSTKLANALYSKQSKNAAAVRHLSAKCKLLEAERNVRQTEYNLLDDAARSRAQDVTTSFDSLMDTFVARKRNAMSAVIEMDEQIEELDKEIWRLNCSHKGETAAVVVATLLAKRDCKIEFQLTYLLTGVTWKPCYDLHASTATDGKPSSDVSLRYCANITQTTGEDWTNAVLILSTATSQALHSLTIPKVDPLRLLPARSVGGGVSQQQQQQDEVAYLRGRTQMRNRAPVGPCRVPTTGGAPPPPTFEEDFEDIVQTASDEEVEKEVLLDSAVLNQNPLSLTYRVEGRVSLPSDGVAHKVAIAVLGFSAALQYVCVPRKTAAAFIEGRIKNTSEYELLAGPVSVLMDDSFITKTHIPLIGVNESFTCVLGIDMSLRVSCQVRSRTEHEPQRSFAEAPKTTTRTITTTIHNGHSFDVSGLVVRDAIPLGDKEANIKVALRRPEGLAQAKDGEEVTVAIAVARDGTEERQEAIVRWGQTENGGGGEKAGLYEWVCELKAGKKVRLDAEWEVKAPSSLQWEEQSNKREILKAPSGMQWEEQFNIGLRRARNE